MKITDEELEQRLGRAVDDTMSALAWTSGAMPPAISMDALRGMIKELGSNLRELYVDALGSDPWEDHPQEIQP